MALLVATSFALSSATSAIAKERNPSSVTLSGPFGEVSVHTGSGQLTDLRLRDPDGLLAPQTLSLGAIGTSVVAEDGARYESQRGSPHHHLVLASVSALSEEVDTCRHGTR